MTFRAISVLAGWLTIAQAQDMKKALDYLEVRQREWAAWKPAQRSGGPCVSCHSGLSYLFALREMEGVARRPEAQAQIEGVRSRVLADPPKTMFPDAGPEAVLNLLTLSFGRAARDQPVDEPSRLALERIWKNQQPEGGWKWFLNGLDPHDTGESVLFGAAMVEAALAWYPEQPAQRLDAVREFVRREWPGQPLHNKLAWIAFDTRRDASMRESVLRELWAAQSKNGGFGTKALGPWAPHPEAPPDPGSNAYTTAWAAFTVRRSGVPCSDPRLAKALSWLRRKQDPVTGTWTSPSMNQVYEQGSTQAKFMTDAATGFAAAALSSCR